MRARRLYISTFFLALTVGMHGQFIEPDRETTVTVQTGENTVSGEMVRSIQAELLTTQNNSIKISWRYSGAPKEWVIARANRPITSRDILLASDSIGIIRGDVDSYLDSSLVPGTYYYAVVEKDKIKDNNLFLYAGENFTTKPVVIQSTQVNSSGNMPPQVSLIFAQPINDTDIRLSWRGISTPNISYHVYRSTEELNNPTAINRATRIAVIQNGAEFFLDNNLPGPGYYYYAVTTVASDGAEDKNLVPDQSYTRKGIRYAVTDLPLVQNLTARLVGTNSVEVNWQDVNNAISQDYTYQLYRSGRPIQAMGDLSWAQNLGTIRPNRQSYSDNGLSGGDYYYAMLTLDAAGKASNRFASGQNTTVNPVSVNKNSGTVTTGQSFGQDRVTEYFADFAAYRRNNVILLSWRATMKTRETAKASVQLYRFKKKPENLGDILDGEAIASLPVEQVLYEDNPEDGVYFYGIFLDTIAGLKPGNLSQGENLIGPVYFKPEKAEISRKEPSLHLKKKKKEPDLNTIIKDTYLQGKYAECLEQLKKYTGEGSKKTRSKALFYSGLSLYRQGKYDTALEFFIHPIVTKAYDKRADFWYKRTVEKIKRD